ncbi:D-alanyl-D-alanine carboxypeptidase family protein [Streptomyces sp. NPDC060194]|uniref:D-alanyl-D-alanine carboxypeptidase family protein n=1 Tax=Streptomyces sp. NPDC060194 TaxID=3347069 RepID=UPI0036499743
MANMIRRARGAMVTTAAVAVMAGGIVPAHADRDAPPATDTRAEARPWSARAPRVTSLSWMVTEVESGRVLGAKNAHRPLPPASTLKALFALTVLPKFRHDAVHRAEFEDLTDIEPGSSMVGMKEGVRYTVADLWRGVFLASGNDAVRALARMNGGVPGTIAEMQATARRLGARDTVVKSADGYDTPGQSTSAHDLTLFARAGLADPAFLGFASTKSAWFPAKRGKYSFGVQNTNRLLVGSHGVKPYEGLLGVKNGYTTHAGNTLVTAARRGGRTLIVSVMNPRDGGANAAYEETRALLDWGFAAPADAPAAGNLGPPAPAAAGPSPSASAAPASRPPAEAAAAEPKSSLALPLSLLGATLVALFVLRRRQRGGRSGGWRGGRRV